MRDANKSPDEAFFDRADAVIGLANAQLSDAKPGIVSASTLYAAARFNAWVTALSHANGADIEESLDETVDYFVDQYRKMLTENLCDYAGNFDAYMRPAPSQEG